MKTRIRGIESWDRLKFSGKDSGNLAIGFQEPSLDDPQEENQSRHPDTSLMAVSWSRGQALDRRAQWLKEF